MVYVYVLSLKNGKYYVGKTESSPSTRISHHERGAGSEWTKLHAPLSVQKVYKNCDPYDEDKYTLKYMSTYGIENVRGGTFCQVNMKRSQHEFLRKMVNTAKDQCFYCGREGHLAKQCHSKPIPRPPDIGAGRPHRSKPLRTPCIGIAGDAGATRAASESLSSSAKALAATTGKCRSLGREIGRARQKCIRLTAKIREARRAHAKYSRHGGDSRRSTPPTYIEEDSDEDLEYVYEETDCVCDVDVNDVDDDAFFASLDFDALDKLVSKAVPKVSSDDDDEDDYEDDEDDLPDDDDDDDYDDSGYETS